MTATEVTVPCLPKSSLSASSVTDSAKFFTNTLVNLTCASTPIFSRQRLGKKLPGSDIRQLLTSAASCIAQLRMQDAGTNDSIVHMNVAEPCAAHPVAPLAANRRRVACQT